jgi:hypothetical protein
MPNLADGGTKIELGFLHNGELVYVADMGNVAIDKIIPYSG